MQLDIGKLYKQYSKKRIHITTCLFFCFFVHFVHVIHITTCLFFCFFVRFVHVVNCSFLSLY